MPIHLMRRAIGCNQVQSGAIRPPDGADAHSPDEARNRVQSGAIRPPDGADAHPHQVYEEYTTVGDFVKSGCVAMP